MGYGSDQDVARNPAEVRGHKRKHEDSKQVEAVSYAGSRPAKREDEGPT